jgi:hypothetical protein
LDVFTAVVPQAMPRSRLLVVAEIHGPYVAGPQFADAKATCSNLWNGGKTGRRGLPLVPEIAAPREHKFISATEIGRFGDIAVMAQIQRNVGIAVALSGS